MSRFRLPVALFAAASTCVLSMALPALAEVTQLGTLNAQSNWSVGTVNGKRDTYCATVNSFKSSAGDIVLAIARDPSGYGSLAFDFPKAFFKANEEYDTSLTPGAASAKKLKGRASTDRSLIVQVGTDDSFLQSMSKGGKVYLSSSVVSGTFSLGTFDATYKDLLNCSNQLASKTKSLSAAAIDDAEKAALTPVDRAAADIALRDKGRTALFKADEKLALANTANPLDEMEAQIERDAAAEKTKRDALEKEAQAKQIEISQQLETQKQQVIQLQTQKQVMERKLLMSSSGGSGETRARQTVSTIDSEATKKAEKEVADFKARKQEAAAQKNAEQTKLTATQNVSASTLAALTAPPVVRAPEPVKAKDAVKVATPEKIASAIQEAPAPAAAPVEKVERSVVPVINPANEKIARLEEERTSMKKQLELALAEKDKATPALEQQRQKLSDIESRLTDSEKNRQSLEAKLKEAEDRNIKAAADIQARQKQAEEAAAKQTGKIAQEKLDAERAAFEKERKELERKNTELVAAMKLDLETRDKQYAQIQKELEAQKKENAADHNAKTQQAAAIEQMKKDLQAKAAQADALKAELETAKQTAELAEKKTKEQAAAQKAKADADLEAKYAKLNDELSQKQTAMAALETQMKDLQQTRAADGDAKTKQAAAIEQMKKDLDAKTAQADALKAELTTAKQTAEQAEKKTKEQELAQQAKADAELQAKYAKLTEDLTQKQTAMAALETKLKDVEQTRAADGNAKAQQETAIAQMKKDIEEKNAQTEALKKELETAKQATELAEKKTKEQEVAQKAKADAELETKYAKLNDDLGQKQKAMTDLETQMKELEQSRAAEAERAAKAQTELEEARKQLAEMKKAMIEKAANERLASDTAALQAALALTKAETSKAEKAKEVVVAETKPVAAHEPVAAAITPPPATPVEKAPAPVVALDAQEEGAALLKDENKAKSFLDRIVETHQTQKGNKSANVETPKAAVAAVREETVVKDDVKENEVPVAAEPAQKPVQAQAEKKSFLDRILPAGLMTKQEAEPAVAADPALPVFAGGGITLEKLLGYSGTTRVNFVSVSSSPGEVVRQWTSDNLDGLYEQSASNGNIDVQSRIYLDRYRQDCRNNLDVKTEPVRHLSFGRMIAGTLVCNSSGNKYATSFVFLDDRDSFHAILHTGYPNDADGLSRIAGNLSATLARADRFLAPQPAMKRPLRRPLATPVTEVHTAPSSFEDKPASKPVLTPPPAATAKDSFDTIIIE